jgi:hypothetical protein
MEVKRELIKPGTGTYVIRFVKKGPDVPVRLHKLRGGLTADVFGLPQPEWFTHFYPESSTILPESYSQEELEKLLLECVMDGELDRHPFARIVAYGEKCNKSRHDNLIAQRAWAMKHALWHPCLRPREAINLRGLPPMGDLKMGASIVRH